MLMRTDRFLLLLRLYLNLFFYCNLEFLQEVSGVGPRARSITVSSEGDAKAGSIILDISDRLVTTMVRSTHNQTKQSVQTLTVGKRGELG